MDTAQWAQGIGVVKQQPVGLEGSIPKPTMSERKAKPQKDQALNCPRCNSTNTKFCYYNNYSLSQPRYFCKTCRRYWTEGGSLRNVPVGGGSRKNKRSSTCSSSSSKKLPDLNPNKIQQGQDLNLACPLPPPEDYNNNMSKFIEVPFSTEDKTTTPSHHHDQLSSLELLKTGPFPSSRTTTLCSLMPMSAASDSSGSAMYNSSDGFPSLQDFKPPSGLSFSLEGFANGYGGISGIHEGNSGDDGGARLLFPTEDLKQVPSSTDDHYEQNRGHAESTGFWNGMLGGGSW